MINQENVHHQTRRGADLAIARQQISQESHAAVLAGELSLDDAKDYGRERGPHGEPVGSRISKDDRSRECMCQCGTSTRGRFAMGHDMTLLRYAYEYLRGQRELTEEQLTYVRDETDKLERARNRVLREDEKAAHAEDRRRESEAAKAAKQANASE